VNKIELISPSGIKEICITEKNSENIITIIDFEKNEEEKRKNNFNLIINIDKNAENAKVSVIARYETQKKQIKECNISVFLYGKNQTAHLDIRGVSEDFSLLSFNGGGIVTKKSEQCSVVIVQKIYLFSEKAKAKATPVLRVETDNILSASHSASIAPFSDNLFFYMETRGITKIDAQNLLRIGLLKI